MKKRRRCRKRKCLHCGIIFEPDVHNAHHQRFCGKDECQRASHRESSRRYRQKKLCSADAAEFKKKEVERTQEWRCANPGYRDRKKKQKNPGKKAVLRDFACSENFGKDESLRDFLFFYILCFQGLISQLTGVLRDDIGSVMNHYYDKGKELVPELEKQLNEGGFVHGSQGNNKSWAPPPDTGRFRVGRSPPGT